MLNGTPDEPQGATMRFLATFAVQLAMAAEHGPRTHTRRPIHTDKLTIHRLHMLATGTYIEETI